MTVSGTETWELEAGQSVLRDTGFTQGAMVAVEGADASLTLKNIILDSNEVELESTFESPSPIVYVDQGATLNVQDGAVLQNLKTVNGNAKNGAVFVGYGTFNMSGGEIKNNKGAYFGGGVYLRGPLTEQNNRTTMNFTGGTISDNTSGHGGGIYIYHYSDFNMDGGTITRNTATMYGGGIYVQSTSVADIKSGDITYNNCEGNQWGGGGIYINDSDNLSANHAKGLCIIHNAEIAYNKKCVGKSGNHTAEELGYDGCIACCPTGVFDINITEGSVIHDNENAREIVAYLNANTKKMTLSPIMLGGALYNWKDGYGNPLPLDGLVWLNQSGPAAFFYALTDVSTTTGTVSGIGRCRTHIMYNESMLMGSAIGCNGVLQIGKSDGDVTLEVSKEWDSRITNIPEEITVDVFANGTKIGFIILTAAEGWHKTVTDLPKWDFDGNEYEYSFKEPLSEQRENEFTCHINVVKLDDGDEDDSTEKYNVMLENTPGEPKLNEPGLEKWIISEDPIICFGDTFRSGATFVSIVIDGQKVLTTKDRFAFEGDGSTDQLITSFLANNPGEKDHNEHQWGYKAKAVAGKPHCLMIVPADADHQPISAAECEIVGMGGHDRIFMPLTHKVKNLDVEAGEEVTYTLISNVPDKLGDYIEPEPAGEPIQTMAVMGVRNVDSERGTYILTFHDKLNEHLTFVPNSVKVTVNGVELASDLYEVVQDPEDNCTFHVVMDLVAIYEAGGYFTFEEIESAPPIVVTFNATVNEETPHGAYPNEAWVSYEDETSEHDIVHVHVYAIDVLKYDQEDYSFIVCLGDTFRSGGTYVSFKIGDEKIITTKDRFAFEGDHSTTELVDSFIANNPDALEPNEHQWGYRAEAVEGRPTCIRIVPLSSAKIISRAVDSGYFVGFGGHEHVEHPENYPVEITFDGGSEVRIPLQGGEFALYDNADCEGEPIAEGVSDENGLVIFEGLDSGVYYLKETKAPDGYIRNKNPLRVVVKETDSPNPIIHIAHTKFANSNIPHTGGEGTTQFTIIGAVLLVASAVVFVISKKKKKDKAH